MSSLGKLRETISLTDLAQLLGFQPKAISYILYKIPNNSKYISFTISKKNGGERTINAPVEKLKKLQSRLAEYLSSCFDEITNKSKSNSLSHGFRNNHSIVTNSKNHVNKRYVFNIDLEDFFPSFNFGRVRGFFIKNNHFKLNQDVATIIAQIACHNNELPQGSPCSPIISNLIGHLLDIKLVNLAKFNKCTYSRYADDLTFSTNKKEFPRKISFKDENNEWVVGSALRKTIKKVGFCVNDNKTSMQYKLSRQMVTGLVVNKKINIKKEYYRNARSMCCNLFKNGSFYIDENVGTINQLNGILSHIYYIKKYHDKREKNLRKCKPCSIIKLYREFLFFKYFFSIDKPLILCEGKTDITYIKCALKSLKTEYDSLIKIEEDKFKYLISFLKISKNFKNVFEISDGTSGLRHIMDIYDHHMKTFKCGGKQHPVIIIVDNDDGAKEIKGKLKKDKLDTPFYYYCQNLYIVPTPLGPNGENAEIEDLFDNETLETKVDGKVFSKEKKINTKKYFSKSAFAEKVILPNYNEISFQAFKKIFDSILLVINDYKNKESLNP